MTVTSITHDERRPALSEQLGRFRNRTKLTISLHAPDYSY